MLSDLAEEVIAHMQAEPLGHRLVLRRITWLPRQSGQRDQEVAYTTFFEAKAVSVGGKAVFVARSVPCLSLVAGSMLVKEDGSVLKEMPDKKEWLCVVAPDERKFKAYFCSYLMQVDGYRPARLACRSINYQCCLTDHTAPYECIRDLQINSSLYSIESNQHNVDNKRFDDALSLMQVLRANPKGFYAWVDE